MRRIRANSNRHHYIFCRETAGSFEGIQEMGSIFDDMEKARELIAQGNLEEALPLCEG
jgi:hypothetical protein